MKLSLMVLGVAALCMLAAPNSTACTDMEGKSSTSEWDEIPNWYCGEQLCGPTHKKAFVYKCNSDSGCNTDCQDDIIYVVVKETTTYICQPANCTPYLVRDFANEGPVITACP